MKGERREIWEQRYETWKDSGLSIIGFSQQNGLNHRSVCRRVTRLSSRPAGTRQSKKKSFVAGPGLKAYSPQIRIRINPSGEVTIDVQT